MTEAEIKAIEERPTTLYEKWLEVKVQELEQDNARLRGLIKEAAEKHMFCPWCPALGDAFHTRHAKTCPACTRDGTVR